MLLKLTPDRMRKHLPVMQVLYTEKPVKIDGKLDDEVWRYVKAYNLTLSKDRQLNDSLAEKGFVQLAWGNEYFYPVAKFHDSDIVAEGQENQLHHCQFGDVCELFLKPADSD